VKLKTNLILSLSLAIIVTVVVMANNRKAETFKLPTLLNLDSSKAAQNLGKNKILIVSYFQTWCGDCVKEQPQLQQLKQRYNDTLEILMVSDEPLSKIAAFKARFQSGLNFYHSTQKLKADLGVSAYPTTYLLDKKGKILLKKVEGIQWYTPEVLTLINQAIK
jgi:thiol-disulfide isomerase/thioredoxin